MREILFRGKNKNNNWIYGKLLNHKRIITQSDEETEEMPCFDMCDYQEEVIENTIGQYTELKDKNGKKIFEGDIVGCFCNTQIFEVKWCDIRGGYFLDDIVLSSGCEPNVECLGNLTDTMEVLGNIYDNPELLGE